MGCLRWISTGLPSWRRRNGDAAPAQSDSEEIGAGAAPSPSRRLLPQEGVPAHPRAVGCRTDPPGEAIAGVTDGGRVGRLLRRGLARAPALAPGDAQTAPLYRPPECRTCPAPPDG